MPDNNGYNGFNGYDYDQQPSADGNNFYNNNQDGYGYYEADNNQNVDYGYPVQQVDVDYGYAEDEPVQQVDFDYGYAENEPAQQVDVDYGYAENEPAQQVDVDYGYAENEPVQQLSANYGYVPEEGLVGEAEPPLGYVPEEYPEEYPESDSGDYYEEQYYQENQNDYTEISADTGRAPFTVNISDDDYNAPDELDANYGAAKSSKPKFEVHIEDDEDDLISFEPDAIPYSTVQGLEPVRINPVIPPAVNQNEQQVEKKKKKQKKFKKRNGYHSLLLFFIIMTVLTTTVSVIGISCINDILAFSRSDKVVTVKIPTDATTNDVVDILHENGLVKQDWFCKLYNYLFTTVFNRAERTYKGGVYYVESNLGFEGYLTEFSTTQTGAKTYMVTIPEGYTIYQIADRLDNFDICDRSKFLASITGTDFNYSFIKSISVNNNRTFKLEGYLYPDTYEFYEDDDPNSVIRKMLDRSDEMWTDEYEKRAKELGYTRDEIMIIASIIEREAANVEQMDEISSVIHNRLQHPSTWPTIDCDSTSNYINKYVSINVSAGQASTFASAYNTYSAKGLPPGPICNPGADAIYAALYPSETNYYFFRHDNNGKIYMAETQAEHDANANLVLKANSGSTVD